MIFYWGGCRSKRTSARSSNETESVQDVLNAWSAILTGPKPHAMSADFSVLFAKMQANWLTQLLVSSGQASLGEIHLFIGALIGAAQRIEWPE